MIIIFLACIAEYGSFNNGSLTGALVFHDETWQGEVLLLPGGTKKVTGIDFGQAEVLPTAGPIKDEEILKLLMTSAKPKKNKKKKAKEAEGAKDGAEA